MIFWIETSEQRPLPCTLDFDTSDLRREQHDRYILQHHLCSSRAPYPRVYHLVRGTLCHEKTTKFI